MQKTKKNSMFMVAALALAGISSVAFLSQAKSMVKAWSPDTYSCSSLHYGIVESTYMGKVYQPSGVITTARLSSLSDGKSGIDIDTTDAGAVTWGYMDQNTAGYALKLGKAAGNGSLKFKLTKSVIGITIYALGWKDSVSSLKVGENVQNVVDATESFPTKKASASMFQFHPYTFDFETGTNTITIETADGESGNSNNVVMISSMAFKIANP